MRRRLLLASVLLVSVLAACGKGEVKPASSGDPTTTTSTEADTTDTTEATSGAEGEEDAATGEAAEVAYTATEYAYALDGERAPSRPGT